MNWAIWNNIFAMAAVTAFAVTAVLAIREDRSDRRMDLFAALVFGLSTAIGGGTARDVILDVPVFWAQDLNYVWVALAASAIAFYGTRIFEHRHMNNLMLYLDGFGAALFGVQAAGKVWDLGFGLPVAPVILGILTAIGGGLIRDLLAGRTNLLMKPELYAIPVLIGTSIFTLSLAYAPEDRNIWAVISIVLAFGLRAATIRWHWTVPEFLRLPHR